MNSTNDRGLVRTDSQEASHQRRLRHRSVARLTRRIADLRASLGPEWAGGIVAGVQESIDAIKAEDPSDPFWSDPSVDNY